MFSYKRKSPARQFVEDVGFPLQQVEYPVREKIFRQMSMDQLVKMSLESKDAAKEIKASNVIPKTLNIVVGHNQDRKVEFSINGFSCYIGTRRALKELESNYTWFPVQTITGKVIPKCTNIGGKLFMIVPDEGELLGAVLTFYMHICNVFGEPLTYNFSVFGEFAYMAAEILKIRDITSVDTLDLCGYWNYGPEQKPLFHDFITRMRFNKLGIYGTPPQGSEIIDITADHVHFSLGEQAWLSEERLLRVDAKEIILHSFEPEYFGNQLGTILAERFNYVMKCWGAGTGFRRLELLKFKVFKNILMNRIMNNLETQPWDRRKRPGYYCVFDSTQDGSRSLKQFSDLRQAKDVKNQQGELGTIMVGNRDLDFMVWTRKQFENLEVAFFRITLIRDRFQAKVDECTRGIGRNLDAKRDARIRVANWGVGVENQEWREHVEDVQDDLMVEEDPDERLFLQQELEELRAGLRAEQRKVWHHEDMVEKLSAIQRENMREVSKYNGYLDIINQDFF